MSAPIGWSRTISGTQASASRSSAGVPGTIAIRGSVWAAGRFSAVPCSITQPVIPSPMSSGESMISSAQRSTECTGSIRRSTSFTR